MRLMQRHSLHNQIRLFPIEVIDEVIDFSMKFRRISTDQRSSEILTSKEKLAMHQTNHDNSMIDYNNHAVFLSNIDVYETLDDMIFHSIPLLHPMRKKEWHMMAFPPVWATFVHLSK